MASTVGVRPWCVLEETGAGVGCMPCACSCWAVVLSGVGRWHEHVWWMSTAATADYLKRGSVPNTLTYMPYLKSTSQRGLTFTSTGRLRREGVMTAGRTPKRQREMRDMLRSSEPLQPRHHAAMKTYPSALPFIRGLISVLYTYSLTGTNTHINLPPSHAPSTALSALSFTSHARARTPSKRRRTRPPTNNLHHDKNGNDPMQSIPHAHAQDGIDLPAISTPAAVYVNPLVACA